MTKKLNLEVLNLKDSNADASAAEKAAVLKAFRKGQRHKWTTIARRTVNGWGGAHVPAAVLFRVDYILSVLRSEGLVRYDSLNDLWYRSCGGGWNA